MPKETSPYRVLTWTQANNELKRVFADSKMEDPVPSAPSVTEKVSDEKTDGSGPSVAPASDATSGPGENQLPISIEPDDGQTKINLNGAVMHNLDFSRVEAIGPLNPETNQFMRSDFRIEGCVLSPQVFSALKYVGVTNFLGAELPMDDPYSQSVNEVNISLTALKEAIEHSRDDLPLILIKAHDNVMRFAKISSSYKDMMSKGLASSDPQFSLKTVLTLCHKFLGYKTGSSFRPWLKEDYKTTIQSIRSSLQSGKDIPNVNYSLLYDIQVGHAREHELKCQEWSTRDATTLEFITQALDFLKDSSDKAPHEILRGVLTGVSRKLLSSGEAWDSTSIAIHLSSFNENNYNALLEKLESATGPRAFSGFKDNEGSIAYLLEENNFNLRWVGWVLKIAGLLDPQIYTPQSRVSSDKILQQSVVPAVPVSGVYVAIGSGEPAAAAPAVSPVIDAKNVDTEAQEEPQTESACAEGEGAVIDMPTALNRPVAVAGPVEMTGDPAYPPIIAHDPLVAPDVRRGLSVSELSAMATTLPLLELQELTQILQAELRARIAAEKTRVAAANPPVTRPQSVESSVPTFIVASAEPTQVPRTAEPTRELRIQMPA